MEYKCPAVGAPRVFRREWRDVETRTGSGFSVPRFMIPGFPVPPRGCRAPNENDLQFWFQHFLVHDVECAKVCVVRGLAATGILSAPGSRDDVHFKTEGTTGKTGTQSKGEL